MNALPRLALLLPLAAWLACDRPTPLPDVGLSASAVRFEALGGAGDPPAQSIYLTNAGAGDVARPAISVAYQEGAGWLTAAVLGAGAPYEVRLRAQVGALAPGTYRATVTLTSESASGGPLQAAVTLVVPEPRFALSLPTLSFQAPRGGGNPVAQQVLVTNGGRGTLPVPQVSVTYGGAEGWLAAAVTEAAAGYAVDARADVAGLPSGTYGAVLTFTADGAAAPPRTLGVTLVVPPVELALSSSSVFITAPADGSPPAEAELLALNAGGGIMAPPVQSSEQLSWLRGATVVGTQAPYRLLVHTRSEGMATGTYTGRLWFQTSYESPQRVALDVTLVVPRARMGFDGPVALQAMVTCPLPAPIHFAIRNAGAGALARPVASLEDPADRAWLEVTVSGDRAPYLGTARMLALPPNPVSSGVRPRVRLSAPGAEDAYLWLVAYVEQPALPITAQTTGGVIDIWAQRGAGDPGPVEVPIATSGGCVPPPRVEVVDGDLRPVSWLSATTTVAGAPIVLQASAAGMANLEVRTAYLRTDLPAPELPPDPFPTAPLPGHPATLTAADPAEAGALAVMRRDQALVIGYADQATAIGGQDESGQPLASVEAFDRQHRTWQATSGLREARYRHGAIARGGGQILVVGGIGASKHLATVEWILNGTSQDVPIPELPTWVLDPILVPLRGAAHGHEILVLPNRFGAFGTEAYLWGFSVPSRPVFLGTGSFSAAIGLADGRVLLTGGTEAVLYDPLLDTVAPTGSLGLGRERPVLFLLPGGKVLALGGRPDTTTEIWDPATGLWSAAAPPVCHVASAISLGNGRVASLGGSGEGCGGAAVEVYDPAADQWTRLADLASPIGFLSLARLPDGMLIGTGRSNPPAGRTITW